MKKFHIYIFAPTQSIRTIIRAETFQIEDGHLVFFDEDDELVASYPASITAIENVVNVDTF